LPEDRLRGGLTRLRQLFSTARIANAFPAIYRARGRYTRAGHYAFYDTPNPGERRTVPSQPTLRSSLMPRSLVSGHPKYTKIANSVQSPSDNETRKWRRRQSGRSADRIAYVAYKLAMGNLTDTRPREQGMILGLVLSARSPRRHPKTTTTTLENERLYAKSDRSDSLDLAIQGR